MKQWGGRRSNNGWFNRTKKDGTPLESSIQMQVARWIHLQYPHILWTASTEGMKLPKHIALMLQLMGYRPGTPDILICEPVGIYHGLHLEMKSKGGVQSANQKEWQARAEERGYYYALAHDLEEAKVIIDKYLHNVKGA